MYTMCAVGSLTKATLARVKPYHQMIRIFTCFCDTFPLIDGNRLAGFLEQQQLEETVLIYLLSEKIHLPIGTSINRDVQLLVETKILRPQEPWLLQRLTSLPTHHHRRAKQPFLPGEPQLLPAEPQLLPAEPHLPSQELQLPGQGHTTPGCGTTPTWEASDTGCGATTPDWEDIIPVCGASAPDEETQLLTEKPQFQTEDPQFPPVDLQLLLVETQLLTEEPQILIEEPQFLSAEPQLLTEEPWLLSAEPQLLT